LRSGLHRFARHEALNVEQFDDALKKALGELMASDTPMSPHERKWYGDGLQWLKSQRRRRAIRPESKAQFYNWEIDALVRDGYTVAEAKSKIVEAHNLASVEALDQFLRRHRKNNQPAKTVR
jgi:hypothetical protein